MAFVYDALSNYTHFITDEQCLKYDILNKFQNAIVLLSKKRLYRLTQLIMCGRISLYKLLFERSSDYNLYYKSFFLLGTE